MNHQPSPCGQLCCRNFVFTKAHHQCACNEQYRDHKSAAKAHNVFHHGEGLESEGQKLKYQDQDPAANKETDFVLAVDVVQGVGSDCHLQGVGQYLDDGDGNDEGPPA